MGHLRAWGSPHPLLAKNYLAAGIVPCLSRPDLGFAIVLRLTVNLHASFPGRPALTSIP